MLETIHVHDYPYLFRESGHSRASQAQSSGNLHLFNQLVLNPYAWIRKGKREKGKGKREKGKGKRQKKGGKAKGVLPFQSQT